MLVIEKENEAMRTQLGELSRTESHTREALAALRSAVRREQLERGRDGGGRGGGGEAGQQQQQQLLREAAAAEEERVMARLERLLPAADEGLPRALREAPQPVHSCC